MQTTLLFVANDLEIKIVIMVLPSCNYKIDPNIQILINDQWIEVGVQTFRPQTIGIQLHLAIHFSKRNCHQAFDLESYIESQSNAIRKLKITNKKGEVFDICFNQFYKCIFLKGDLQCDRELSELSEILNYMPDMRYLMGSWIDGSCPSQPTFLLEVKKDLEKEIIRTIIEEGSFGLYEMTGKRPTRVHPI